MTQPLRGRFPASTTAVPGAVPILLLCAIEVVRAYAPQTEVFQAVGYAAAGLFTAGALVGLALRTPLWAYSWIAFAIAAFSRMPAPFLRGLADTAQGYGFVLLGSNLIFLAAMGLAAFILAGRGRAHGIMAIGFYVLHSALTFAVPSSALDGRTLALPWVLLYVLACVLTAWVAYRAVAALESEGRGEAGPAVLRVLIAAVAASVVVGSFLAGYFGWNVAVMLAGILEAVGLLVTAGILIAIASFRGRQYPAGTARYPED